MILEYENNISLVSMTLEGTSLKSSMMSLGQ